MKGFSVDSASKKAVKQSKTPAPDTWRDAAAIDTRKPQWAHLAQKWGRK